MAPVYFKRRRWPRIVCVLVLYGVFFGFTTMSVYLSGSSVHDTRETFGNNKGRHLLQEEVKLNCTPRSIDQFPGDFFNAKQRSQGGVVIHILLSIYIFGTLAIICDDYFVSSLEKLAAVMKLQPDVAGATLMAAGSSAPELFTSVIGVFFAKSDVGIGTIVGSAVFNILFIIAICGLFGGMVIYLTWWPMLRDCLYYILSIVVLVLVIYDEKVYWYEALVMLLLYVLYIVLMYFNPRLGAYCTNRFNQWQESRNQNKGVLSNQTAEINETEPLLASGDKTSSNLFTRSRSREGNSETAANAMTGNPEVDFYLSGEKDDPDAELGIKVAEEEEYESPFSIPESFPQRVFWLLMLPAQVLFVLTIPDCRRPGCWQKTYVVTFLMSIVWIAGLSYIMVWMVTIIGDTLGIPDTVMGLSLLAAGTSVPDAMASLFVARDGYGDMAVSNSIGSNVFDILLCLGLPWIIQTGFVEPNSTVKINSGGLTFSAVTLLGTVVFMLVAVIVNRWRLTKKLGVFCLFVYALFLALSIMYETNVFGPLNPAACPRTTSW